MKAILVFNNMNDLIYWKWNHIFVKHVLNLAKGQGLIAEDMEVQERDRAGELSPDVVIQIFSPIITSQKIMSCQFGNSYTSVQCKDGTNIVFDEFVGYLLVQISTDSVGNMQRDLATCINLLQYFCGPDPSFLKHEKQRAGADLALRSWQWLRARSQAALLGALEALGGGGEAAAAAGGALRAALDALPPPRRAAHAVIFVGSKLLALYSSRGAEDLTPMDLFFLGVMCTGAELQWSRRPPSTEGSRSPSPSNRDDEVEDILECGDFGQTLSWTVILGTGAPFVLLLRRLSAGATLALCLGCGGAPGAGPALRSALLSLAGLAIPLAQANTQQLRPDLARLETAMKKVLDTLKKNKNQPDSPQRKLQSHWEALKKKTSDIIRASSSGVSWMSAEAALCPLRLALRTAYHLQCEGFSPSVGDTSAAFDAVHSRLGPLYDFLRVKAMKNFSLTSSPLMSKYVEEFPGLVHFLFIDRSTHRLTAPSLEDCSHMLSRKKIWRMVERGCNDTRAGHTASMWKDESLHYAHLLWWEDAGGAPLRPRQVPVASLPSYAKTPAEYYNKLTEVCFPATKGVRCLELYAVHLGLLPAGTALAHFRRLAATVGDLWAVPHPAGLL